MNGWLIGAIIAQGATLAVVLAEMRHSRRAVPVSQRPGDSPNAGFESSPGACSTSGAQTVD